MMASLPYDKNRFVVIDGKREYAPVGTHICHDGVEYPLNCAGCCDRCGVDTETEFKDNKD
jgi:hypothetical protein